MNVTDRINRILFIMSYVSQNQGVTVDELAAQVAIKPRELLKEIDFILLVGKPPFQPDDYVDIYVEDDRVFIEFDQMLNRPLRFTQPEAIALFMSLQLLDPAVDPTKVKSLKKKIQNAISDSLDTSDSNSYPIVFEQTSAPVSDQFGQLREAIDQNSKVQLDYYSLTRNQKRKRTIHPYFLTKSLGYWYLTGHCELRDDVRTFKFERILSVRIVQEAFQPPADLDIHRYRDEFLAQSGQNEIEIHFDPAVSSWILEAWGNSAHKNPDGSATLTFHSDTLEYPSRLVLSYAPYAHPVRPQRLIDKVGKDSLAIIKLYEIGPTE